MNEFIEQFLVEARDLIEQATGDLLALEERPHDRARLDSAFRAFHTLKGGAGIVEFAAMSRALHAAEDVLAELRTRAAAVTSGTVSDCLTCLDQVVDWLDHIQETGQLPAEAEQGADVIVRRFSERTSGGMSIQAVANPTREQESWVDELVVKYPVASADSRAAVRYAPGPDCFLRGEDPIAILANLPGLLALDFNAANAWPPLDGLDPYSCNLIFRALTSASAEQAALSLAKVRDWVDIQPIRQIPASSTADSVLPPRARELLEAQLLLLAQPVTSGSAGNVASAGKVAANVLRHCGRVADALKIDAISAESLTDATLLIGEIEHVLKVAGAEKDESDVGVQIAHELVTRTLRVDVERIDALVRLTGELTVVKNAIGHAATMAGDGAHMKTIAGVLNEHHGALDRLIAELQRSVLAIRVLPLHHVFQRFPRLIRDMGISVGKSARLVTEGEHTEADKAIVEGLAEPLLHVFRNAMDHGIEPARERTAAGKPETATVFLRASRDGEHVLIEIEDDGRGIDTAKVRQVAAQRGIASVDALAAMPDDQIVELIFSPGFSTVGEITNLSGRGVGMDAVRNAIERLGGRVTVTSRPGMGTIVRFILPFTVMMTRVMTVEVAGQLFGIPLDAVVETARVARDLIVPVGTVHAFALRNRTIPLIDLAKLLGEANDDMRTPEATVVVASTAGHIAAIEVHRVGHRMDVMLKPMDGLLAGLHGIAGTTLMGDGRVLMVLDLQELIG